MPVYRKSAGMETWFGSLKGETDYADRGQNHDSG